MWQKVQILGLSGPFRDLNVTLKLKLQTTNYVHCCFDPEPFKTAGSVVSIGGPCQLHSPGLNKGSKWLSCLQPLAILTFFF